MDADAALATWHAAERARQSGQAAAARQGFAALAAHPDWIAPARLRLSQLALADGRLREAVDQALAARAADESDPAVLEALVAQLCQLGELQAARDLATSPAIAGCADAAVLFGAAQRLMQQSFPAEAAPLLQRARAFGADHAALHYQLGLSALYAGELDAADAAFEACLARDPLHGGAHRQLAKLRTATPERNHVARLRAVAARLGDAHPDAPPVSYALFKELDDLGDTDAAWAALVKGMAQRRAQLDVDPAAEQALFDRLMRVDGQGAHAAVQPGPQPVFIVGQPRSGTTLLERLLGAAPQVADAGELRDFGFQLRVLLDRAGPNAPDAALVDAAAGVDPGEWGARYLAHTQWRAGDRPLYTDKLPANVLWLGHIARALPGARFLHLVRDPMDVGFSNLKELFADAYPHSYDQDDMAAHLRRYLALMDHWRAAFPGRILDVAYADLVTDPEGQARRVLAFLGLPWTPAVLAPEARAGAVATASAAQVREPIHARFLGQWRRYARWLEPLRAGLEGA